MSSQPRIEIQGQAPFKQSGVYEAQISITDVKPSDDEIRSKQFSSIWQGHFHLKVKDGVFSETIGDSKNPLPSSIDQLDTIWIVVSDLFSSLYSVFDVTLRTSSKIITSEKQKSFLMLLKLQNLNVLQNLVLLDHLVQEVQLVIKDKLVQLVQLVIKDKLVQLVHKALLD